MLKSLLTSVMILALTSACFAANVTGAEIVEYGVFDKIRSVGPRKDAGSVTGQVDQVPEVRLKEKTSTVVAALGTNFGIVIKLTGDPAGELVDCSIRWIHPKLTNPNSGRTTERNEIWSQRRIGEPEPTGYTFENAWEMVPGKWTIQLICKSKVLAEKTFDVVLAR
jgi:hypothetical protein